MCVCTCDQLLLLLLPSLLSIKFCSSFKAHLKPQVSFPLLYLPMWLRSLALSLSLLCLYPFLRFPLSVCRPVSLSPFSLLSLSSSSPPNPLAVFWYVNLSSGSFCLEFVIVKASDYKTEDRSRAIELQTLGNWCPWSCVAQQPWQGPSYLPLIILNHLRSCFAHIRCPVKICWT